jgi:PTH1 family peptidyl-tRNA hydrolase
LILLVVGLGNPGERYAQTRHNVGFLAVERLLERCGGAPFREKFSGRLAQIELAGDKLLVLEPQTFMNESGQSVGPALAFHRLAPSDLVVVHDELDLPFGDLRLKQGGGDAGHRGLRSVTAHVGSSDYARLRIGIGRPPPEFQGDIVDFVLQGFPLADRAELSKVLDRAAEAIELVAEKGLPSAMNQINRRVKPSA